MPEKREEIQPRPGDKRYVRRDERGQFSTDQSDEGRSLTADRSQRAKREVPPGQGDRGDQKRR